MNFLRRILRFVFHLAACFSALVFLACLFFWPRSYGTYDVIAYEMPTHAAWLSTSPGRGALWLLKSTIRIHPGLSWTSKNSIPVDHAVPWTYTGWGSARILPGPGFPGLPFTRHNYLGVTVTHRGPPLPPATAAYVLFQVPFPYLTVLAALLPILWLRAWRRGRAHQAHGFPVGLMREAVAPPPPDTRPASPAKAPTPPATPLP